MISEEELVNELNNFKFTLQNFDFSDIKNIIFINFEALYFYIEQVEDNPFHVQYQKLQNILDVIEPYIPFVTEDGFISIIDVNLENSNELDSVKKIFSSKKRLNFTNIIRYLDTKDDWQYILNICKEIRNNYLSREAVISV